YPSVNLTRQFASNVNIRAAAGDTVNVVGFVVSGGSGYDIEGFHTSGESRIENNGHDVTFANNTCVIPTSAKDSSCVYVHDRSHDITVTDNFLKSDWNGVKCSA